MDNLPGNVTEMHKRKRAPQRRKPMAERKASITELPKLGEEWAKLARESAQAYASFQAYYQLPKSERTLTRAAEIVGRHRTQLTTWSSLFHWVERARAYDERVEQRELSAQQQQLSAEQGEQKAQQKAAQEESLRAARALKREALRILAKEQEKSQPDRNGKTGLPDAKNIALAGQALEKATQMERIALGLPTDISRTDITLRETVQEALQSQRLLRDLIAEELCDACRAKIRAKMVRLAERDRELSGRLA
jgi:hypothetical protein